MAADPNNLDANYYFGFISFYEKDYKSALESFRKVENHETYQKIVPYYITELLYFNGEKDKASFWIQMKGDFILIQYFAVRDEQGSYKGVVEVSQEITEIRNLQGEHRLLDWTN